MDARPLVKKIDGNVLACQACSRYCKIPEGQVGYCGVRANDAGRFSLLVYGRPCAVWGDPIEKKPLFHFLPGSLSYSLGTFGCNFSCDFCQNWDISQAPHEAREKDPKGWRAYFTRIIQECRELPPKLAVEEAARAGCKSISFTYNEPTIFTEYALDIMKLGNEKGLKSVYVTNGYESPECWKRLKGKLHAANIDLKGFTDRFYNTLCKAELEPVLQSIRTAKEYGIHVEITTLIIPGWNDKPDELKGIADFLSGVDPEMPWHVTSFSPHYKMKSTPQTQPEALLKAKAIGKEAGLKYVYVGNVPAGYEEHECTSCPGCGKRLIERSGFSITKNGLADGKCRYCKTKIKGVWK
ncbi:MAG: AmmeMemoRadiSam system radical SAM enzyme [Candidatus Micrarchaeota archaeon]